MFNLRQRISAELTLLDFRGFDIPAALRVALGDVMREVATAYGDAQAQEMKERAIAAIHTQPGCEACADAIAAAIRSLPD